MFRVDLDPALEVRFPFPLTLPSIFTYRGGLLEWAQQRIRGQRRAGDRPSPGDIVKAASGERRGNER
jgi:hypothetical protein